jgi:uncharacterized phage-associated protein
MSRPFRFHVQKTIQAVAFLLRRERGRRMNYMRLLKILYLAEREILKESSMPLTGSRVIAMQRGPVLEDVLDLIRGTHIAVQEWSAFIQTDHFHLEMIADPGIGLLSKFVSCKLEEIAKKYEDCDEWAMVEVTHELPEWKRNDPGESSKEIPLAHILEAVGRGADLEKIVSRAREGDQASDFFREPRLSEPV